MKIDLRSDWVELLKERLDALGFDTSKFDNDQDLKFAFFGLVNRLVPTESRDVHVSNEFEVPEEHHPGVNALEEKFENGRPVWPHQSKGLSSTDRQDHMLSDWGIQHFHLGTEAEDDSPYMQRTGPLLFAMVEGEDAYFIDVEEHGAWAKEELLRIVKNNWPQLLEDYRLDTFDTLACSIDDLDKTQRQQMRRNGINVFLEIDSEHYAPPGGGLTSAGTSMDVVVQSDRFVKCLDHLESYVRSNAMPLVRSALDTSTYITSPFCFSLTVHDGDIGVLEEQNDIFFRYRQLSPLFRELLEPENSEYQGITDA